jgi:hypothetical protein
MVLFLLPCAITWLSLNRWVVLDGCHPSGSAVDAGLDAAARARRAARAVKGDVVSVWQVSMGCPAHRQFLRTALPYLTTIVPVTDYY